MSRKFNCEFLDILVGLVLKLSKSTIANIDVYYLHVFMSGFLKTFWCYSLELSYSLFGFKSRSELGLEPGGDPGTVYSVGQVVKCRVVSSIPDSRRINLSFVIKPTRFTSFHFLSWILHMNFFTKSLKYIIDQQIVFFGSLSFVKFYMKLSADLL